MSLKSLISRCNIAPDTEAKYIYDHDMAWPLDRTLTPECGHVTVKPETPVELVRKREDRSFHFKLVGDPIEYTTNYGWAFILVTPENVAVFEELRIVSHLAREAERTRKAVYVRLKTLQVRPAKEKNGATEKSGEDKPAPPTEG